MQQIYLCFPPAKQKYCLRQQTSLDVLCKTMDDVQKANKENERKFAEFLQSLKQKDEKI